MGGFTSWIRAAVVVGGALTVTACSTYPDEPRYSTRPMPTGQRAPIRRSRSRRLSEQQSLLRPAVAAADAAARPSL